MSNRKKPTPPSVAAAAAVLAALLRLDGAAALSYGFFGRQPQTQNRGGFDTALPSAVAAPVDTSTSPGTAAGFDGVDERFDVDYIANALLESSAPSFDLPLPQVNNGAPVPPNNAGVADWPTPDNNGWQVEIANGHQNQPAGATDDRRDRSIRPVRRVMTGRDRRASWDSYAALGAPARHGATGGEIGSPGGTGDWRFATSYGPATTRAPLSNSNRLGSSSTTPPSTSTSRNANSVPNPANGNGLANRRSVMTGAERRATFSSFDPFAPAHEAPSGGKVAADARVPVKSNAERVVETLSALPDAVEEAAEDVASAEVPMDTPARQSLPPHLSLRPIPGKGLGVITNKPIAKGEFVGNYEGEIMTEEVKDRRYLSSLQDTLTDEDREWIQSRLDRGQTLTGCYLYGVSLSDDNIYGRFNRGGEEEESATKPERVYVDAEDEHRSLWTRFINHASPPNNNVNPKSVPESWDGEPRVWFMANRDIEAGEELCFDYGADYWLEGDDVV